MCLLSLTTHPFTEHTKSPFRRASCKFKSLNLFCSRGVFGHREIGLSRLSLNSIGVVVVQVQSGIVLLHTNRHQQIYLHTHTKHTLFPCHPPSPPRPCCVVRSSVDFCLVWKNRLACLLSLILGSDSDLCGCPHYSSISPRFRCLFSSVKNQFSPICLFALLRQSI